MTKDKALDLAQRERQASHHRHQASPFSTLCGFATGAGAVRVRV